MVEKMVRIIGKIGLLVIGFFVMHIDARITMKIRSENETHNQVIVGQPFTLEVIIDDVYGSVQAPIIKGLDGCICQLVGTYSTSINGKATARYSYNIRIDKLGTYIIGPAIVRHQQQELISNQLQVSVVKDLGVVAQKNKANAADSSRAFLRLVLDTEAAVVGQKISCALRFYFQDSSLSLQSIGVPELSHFDVKEISKSQSGIAEIDGEQYHYGQWQWDMYPTKQGELIIPAYSADYEIPNKENNHMLGGFFMFIGNRVEHKRVYSNAASIKVSPLPQYNGQVDAVGSFERFSADIKPGIAKEGEGMVLTLEIEGNGNLQAIAVPKLKMPDVLKYYDSKNEVISPQYDDELPKKRFEFIVQGMKAGTYEIPEQLFTYFDTEKNMYVTLVTCPLAVSIMPGMINSKKIESYTNEDPTILPMPDNSDISDINNVGVWYPVSEREPLQWWLFQILFMLPFLYVGYPIIFERFVVLTGNSARFIRRRAFKQARKKIKHSMQYNQKQALYSIFVELFQTTDIHSIETIFQKKGLLDLLNEWNDFFERIRYVAYAQSDNNNTDELCGMAQQWLDRLEKII